MTTESTYSNIRRRRPTGTAAAAVRDLEADRVIGIVRALTVVVATGLSWYSERVAISAHDIAQHSTTGFTLWHVRGVAAGVLVAAAAIAIAALVLPRAKECRGGMVAAIAGFGISVYSLVSMFTRRRAQARHRTRDHHRQRGPRDERPLGGRTHDRPGGDGAGRSAGSAGARLDG